MRVAMTLFLLATVATAKDWSGSWVSDLGVLSLQQDGKKVTGSYGQGKTVTGAVKGKKLVLKWHAGNSNGTATLVRGKDGHSFTGEWKHGNGKRGGLWRGWRPNPEAIKGKAVDFTGVWRSTLGMVVLEQEGNQVTGTYGSEGWSTLEGTVEGRRLNLTWKRLRWTGPGWFEMAKDGKSFCGGSKDSKWIGQKLVGFERAVEPRAGKQLKGLTHNHLCYYVRAPRNWKAGEKTDVIVLLHGSNWVTEGMVYVTSRMADLGERFMIIGIDGQKWNDHCEPDAPRQNYTYVNWMGKSTYKGYPFTDRESPYLVHEAIKELREKYNLDRVFVGGHSQGCFLTSTLLMHYPESFAGAMLISGGIVMQAEPDAFKDEELQAAQRKVAVAVIHGTKDNVVPYSSGVYNHVRLRESRFPRLALFAAPRGHGYDFLPIADAVNWMAGLTTSDPAALLAWGQERAAKKAWRDVAAVLQRAAELEAKGFAPLQAKLDGAAKAKAKSWHKKISKNTNGKWIEGFLQWKAQFEFAPAAAETMAAFAALRVEHDPVAERLIVEGRKAMRAGDRATGMAKYKKIVRSYYAATRYPIVKVWTEK